MTTVLVIMLAVCVAVVAWVLLSAVFDPERNDRGASLPEYAITLAVFAVLSLMAVQYLERMAEREIRQDADCIGDPYQPACSTGVDVDQPYEWGIDP